jgi:prepilin-type N-terminal cleavage/methylation domain-containing protein
MRRGAEGGVTLLELLLVVAVLALAASLALPRADAASASGADAVAGEVAHALRFARREAIRTGAWHTASFDAASAVLRVYRLDISGTVVEDTSHPVLHPVDKREYRLVLGGGALRAEVASALFQYNSGATSNALSFGPDGAPALISGWLFKTIDPLKYDGQVTVRNGRAERVVKVDAVTGRVTF